MAVDDGRVKDFCVQPEVQTYILPLHHHRRLNMYLALPLRQSFIWVKQHHYLPLLSIIALSLSPIVCPPLPHSVVVKMTHPGKILMRVMFGSL